MAELLGAAQVARFIDHTLLKPDAQTRAFDTLCAEAMQHGFFSVCVNSCRVAYVAKKLAGSGVHVCSVVGFPLGAMTTASKVFETKEAIRDGADEIDMVINIGWLKSGDRQAVEADIRAVRGAAAKAVLKVIIETVLLSNEEKVLACELAKKAGADFVKTSTGFLGGGATVEDVRLMRAAVGPDLGVKASGGVKTYADAVAMIQAGATRIGTSSGVAILTGASAA